MACQARLDTVPYVGLPNVPYSQCEEWCKAGTALVCTPVARARRALTLPAHSLRSPARPQTRPQGWRPW